VIRPFRSVRARLAWWYVVVTAVFLAAFGVVTYALLLRAFQRRSDASLVSAAESFGHAVRLEIAADARPADDVIAEEAAETPFGERSIVVFRADGSIVTRPPSRYPLDRLRTVRGFLTLDPDSDDALRLYATPLLLGGRRYTVAVAHYLRDQAEFLEGVRAALLVGIPLWVACAGLLGSRLVRKALGPVLAMSSEAAAIGAADLTRRIQVHDPADELGRLAVTFNALLDRLTAVVEQQRRFMADASHELRTPLAIVRGEAEVALSRQDRPADELRGALAEIAQESRLLSSIIEDLFLLARADAGQLVLARTSFYLDELIAEAVRSLRSLAERKAIAVTTRLMPDSPIEADERLLRRLLTNLLDNAVKYTPAGGRVEVSLTRMDGFYTIAVADSGTPITGAQRARIFERFYRGESDADGAGLGLPIARSIAELHGGRIEWESGGGNVFRVELPVSS
jgi:heavy metal sensor kinase